MSIANFVTKNLLTMLLPGEIGSRFPTQVFDDLEWGFYFKFVGTIGHAALDGRIKVRFRIPPRSSVEVSGGVGLKTTMLGRCLIAALRHSAEG